MSTPVHAAIALRCSPPEWACFFEVSNDAGWGRSRSADAIAMSLWPSRGLEVHGFEVKVDRRDWLREKKDPAKAEPIARFCDRWWVAVSDEKIVKDGELPSTWGLLVLRGGKLVQAVEAPKLTPEPLNRGFVSCILRRASETTVAKSVLDDLVRKGTAEHIERVSPGALKEAEYWRKQYNELDDTVRAFQTASGVSINKWDAKPIGEAVRAIVGRRLRSPIEEAENSVRQLQRCIEGLNETITALRAVEKEEVRT